MGRYYYYQDNKSAILLEKNGKASNGKRTSTLHALFLRFTDRISKKICPSMVPPEDMTVFFTKPQRRSVLEVQRFDYGSHGTATSQAK
jgi:hypothetical protein